MSDDPMSRLPIQGVGGQASYCVHGRPPYIVCPDCILWRNQMERDEAMLEVLRGLSSLLTDDTADQAGGVG